jgi:hypothetical protein
MGGTAVWQRRETMIGGNLSTEFKLPKADGRGGKSDTTCSMNANYNNKGQGQVRLLAGWWLSSGWAGKGCSRERLAGRCARLSADARMAPCAFSLQLVLRLNSHDYPQLAASMLVPLLATCWQKLFGKDEFA